MLDASLAGIVGQVLWLDAADSSTIIDADGDNANTGTGGNSDGFSGFVAEWLDKSGNGNDQTATGIETPAYALSTQNSNNVVTFDGLNDQISGTGAVTGSEITIFAVYEMTGINGGGRGDIIDLGLNSPQRTTLGVYNGSDPTAITVGGGGGADFNNYSGTYSDNTYYLNTLIHNGADFTGFIDGNNVLNSTAGIRETSTDIHIGNDSTGGNNFNGNIAELIVYERELTATERHDVETYLAGKWGLTIPNVAPAQDTNTGTSLDQGAITTITNAMLSSSDADNTDDNLIYAITDAVDHGTLTNTNTALALGLNDTFRQSDIDNGYITFTHDNTANFSDVFSFSVTDNVDTIAPATFNFTIMNPASPLNAIPNAVFHYDAQDLDGDSDFTDQPADGVAVSAVVNPIGTTQNATQGGGGQQPTYDEDAFGFGKGGLRFDGVDDHIDIANSLLINDTGPWDEKSFAFTFRTGTDIVTNQVIYEQGGGSNGYNLGIWNGDLIAYVWGESYWGAGDQYKSINLGAVDGNTTYSVIMIHDATGATLDDRTFAANVNGGAFTTLTRVDAQGNHTGNVVLGRGDDTHNPLDDSDFNDAGNFDGAIGEIWNWNHALDSTQITNIDSFLQNKWFDPTASLDTNTTATVAEGGAVTVTNANLDTNDGESPDNLITYTLTSLPVNGVLRSGVTDIGINDTFTQADIDGGLITFTHDGTEASADGFSFDVNDGFSTDIAGTFLFNVTGVNDAPTLTGGTASLGQGGTVIFDTTALIATDIDDSDNGLVYTITSDASDGVVSLNGSTIGLGGIFTQQDIIDGNVTYTHNNLTATDDVFGVSVTDGFLTSASQTVTLTIDLSALALSNANTVEGGDVNIDDSNLEYTGAVTDWYDTDWQYRREIIVDSAQVDSDLTDYNLLITGDGLTADFWTNIQNDGGDIVVTDAAGNKLDRELVSIDTVGETLQLYVRTDLSSTVDTQFHIYYGNATATETNDTTTWNAAYTGVWHFDDDFDDGSVSDSSQSNNDAFTRGGFDNSNLATGAVGGAGQFNNGEYLALNYAYTGNNSLAEVSVSAWINTTDTGGGISDNWAILDFDRSEFFNVYIINGAVGFSTSDNGSINDQTGGTGLNDGNWHHITAVYDGTDNILYADGVEVARETNTHGGNDLGRDIRYGIIGDGSEATSFDGGRNNVYYDGQFDNIRLYEGTLDSASIAAEYRNQSSPSTFYSVSGQEGIPSNITYTVTNNTDNGTVYIDTNTNGVLDGGEEIGLGDTYTQTDIDNNLLRYNHDGGETTSDSLSFTTTDSVLTTGENTLNISITPVNDMPTDISLSNNSVLDVESIGTIVGTLSTSDIDLPGDTFTYSIQSDPDGKFTIVDNELRLNATLNSAVQDTHNVVIRTEDGNGGLFDRTFTIDVTRQSGVNILPDNPDITNNSDHSDGSNEGNNNGLGQLIGNFVNGSRSGQLQAFYGEKGLGQIILENVTMTLQSSIAGINIGSNNSVIIEATLEAQNTPTDDKEANQYTRMVEFLKITSEFSDDDILNDINTKAKNSYDNFIDDGPIVDQFDTIKNYNDQRLARIMSALSKTTEFDQHMDDNTARKNALVSAYSLYRVDWWT